jgi:phosphoribosylglycinamide formyltransferase-1
MLVFLKNEFSDSEKIIDFLSKNEIDVLILAGFLLKVPKYLIDQYQGRIINIHPALLPKYGGKGMYGMNVHSAVIAAGESKSGITIHLVDEIYDNGKILFQAECCIEKGETPETLASKIHELEQKHFPQIIEDYILSL